MTSRRVATFLDVNHIDIFGCMKLMRNRPSLALVAHIDDHTSVGTNCSVKSMRRFAKFEPVEGLVTAISNETPPKTDSTDSRQAVYSKFP